MQPLDSVTGYFAIESFNDVHSRGDITQEHRWNRKAHFLRHPGTEPFIDRTVYVEIAGRVRLQDVGGRTCTLGLEQASVVHENNGEFLLRTGKRHAFGCESDERLSGQRVDSRLELFVSQRAEGCRLLLHPGWKQRDGAGRFGPVEFEQAPCVGAWQLGGSNQQIAGGVFGEEVVEEPLYRPVRARVQDGSFHAGNTRGQVKTVGSPVGRVGERPDALVLTQGADLNVVDVDEEFACHRRTRDRFTGASGSDSMRTPAA